MTGVTRSHRDVKSGTKSFMSLAKTFSALHSKSTPTMRPSSRTTRTGTQSAVRGKPMPATITQATKMSKVVHMSISDVPTLDSGKTAFGNARRVTRG